MGTWVAINSEPVGFISLKKHNLKTAEIHVMGLSPSYHGKGIGRDLVRSAEESLVAQGFKFLTVKTLSENSHDANYDKTRMFYMKSGFTPIEEFNSLWDEHNPCLMLIKNLAPSCGYAVIFTSQRTSADHAEYDKVAKKMVELAQSQRGFVGVESSRDSLGFGITVSYWKSLDDIKEWKAHAEHLVAQEFGRSKWYKSFTTRICRIDQESRFSADSGQANFSSASQTSR